jgi:putative copper resistance protein D
MRSASADDLSGGTFVQAMSDAATLALIALLATGAYNGWRGVAAPANIVGSWYGQVLIFKLVACTRCCRIGRT